MGSKARERDIKGFVPSSYEGLIATKAHGFMPIGSRGCIRMNYRVYRTSKFILPPTIACFVPINDYVFIATKCHRLIPANCQGLYLPAIEVYAC